jgi:hypothetical protein
LASGQYSKVEKSIGLEGFGSRLGRLGSDIGGRDRLESLILVMILMNLMMILN